MRRFELVALITASALVWSACGGGDAPPKTGGNDQVEEDQPRRRGSDGPAPDVSAEIGALDKDQVNKTFSDAMPDLKSCHKQGQKRVEFVAGQVDFHLEIDLEGKVQTGYLSRTTLADRETEKCMLAALKKRSWPRPEGGKKGIADSAGYEFPLDDDTTARDAENIDPGQLSETLASLRGDLDACKEGGSDVYEVTVLIATDGKVLSAGVATPNGGSDAAADCIVSVVKGASFPSPGSWPGRAGFAL